MPARNGAAWFIGLLVVVFLMGAWEAMIAPLATGDVYPPYSTLRADPLGAKALFESLSEQPSLAVSRLYKTRPPLDPETILLIMGVNPVGWSAVPKPVLDEYETLLKNGGRIVIAFVPTRVPEMPPNTDALAAQWNLRPRYRRIPGAGSDGESIPRETALYFEAGPEWRILREKEGEPEIAERNLAAGTIVLVGDSYPLSNQGLSDESDGGLIAQLIGPAKSALFDENQFGVSETGSVAVLIRKYRLEGALVMLLVVAALFVWRSASHFLPPREDARSAPVSGRDSQEGLAALLRRNISEDQLLSVCWREWSRSAPRRASARNRTEQVQAEIRRAAEHSDQRRSGHELVPEYRAACRVLMETK